MTFTLDNALVLTRRAYSRKVSALLATMGDENDVDTGVQVGELSEEFTAWRDQWDKAFEENDRTYGAFEAFVNTFGMKWDEASQLEDTLTAFQDAYVGYMTAAQYAEDLADDCGDLRDVPEFIRYHIDWEGVGRDMLIGGDVTYHEGHLFHSNW